MYLHNQAVHTNFSVEPYVFKTMEPVEFQDKLAEKCWNFVTDKLSEVKEPMKCLRNLVVLVKVCVECCSSL